MKKSTNLLLISKQGDGGFSLIEVIIAIGLMAFLGMTIIQTNTNASKQHERIIKEDTQFIQADMAMERIEADLTQIYSPFTFLDRNNPREIEEEAIMVIKMMTQARESSPIDQQKCFLGNQKMVIRSPFLMMIKGFLSSPFQIEESLKTQNNPITLGLSTL